MLFEPPSTAAFTPPPSVVHEPVGRRGSGSSPDMRRLDSRQPNASSSTTFREVLPIAFEAEPAASEIGNARNSVEIAKRLQFLRIEAEHDRISFSEASLADFQIFMRQLRPGSRPYLFLNDNGNLRAVWKNEHREQVALQFLGSGAIQFVIFKQRKGSATVSRIAGIDAMNAILQHVKASGAEGLLFA